MQDKMTLRAFPDEARENVIIELWRNETPLGHIILDGASLEKYISDLAEQRAALKEQVVPDLDPGSRLTAVVDPVWRIPGCRTEFGRPMALRHPGFGWLSFVFPDKEAASIAECLTKDRPQS